MLLAQLCCTWSERAKATYCSGSFSFCYLPTSRGFHSHGHFNLSPTPRPKGSEGKLRPLTRESMPSHKGYFPSISVHMLHPPPPEPMASAHIPKRATQSLVAFAPPPPCCCPHRLPSHIEGHTLAAAVCSAVYCMPIVPGTCHFMWCIWSVSAQRSGTLRAVRGRLNCFADAAHSGLSAIWGQ